MVQPPFIRLIHSTDAPQHVAELKSILTRLKSENRISDFAAENVSDAAFTLSPHSEDSFGILILLTYGVEQSRNEIEKLLKSEYPEKIHFKVIEIIVDNLPYNNSFISFPLDLKPIRSRDDMNLVWKGIEEELERMFPKPPAPKPEIVVTPDPPSANLKTYLKLAGVTVAILVLWNICILNLSPDIDDNPHMVLNIFITVLPLILFISQRKSMRRGLPPQEQKLMGQAINWKQLLKRTGIALLILFVSFYLFGFLLIVSGILREAIIPAILAVCVTLLFLFYRRSSEPKASASLSDSGQTSKKTFLRLSAIGLVFVILSLLFWVIGFEFIGVYYERYDVILLSVITAIFLMAIRQWRKRAKPLP